MKKLDFSENSQLANDIKHVINNVARYERNTAYTRQCIIHVITLLFEDLKKKGECYDYRIQCDELNNTADTIARNEFHICIGINPVNSSEFINTNIVCFITDGLWHCIDESND